LHTDIQYIIDYVLKDEFSLCNDVRSRVPNLPAVKRAVWVSDVLMSTGRHIITSSRRSAVVSSNFKRGYGAYSSRQRIRPPQSESDDENEDERRENRWIPTENQLLQLIVVEGRERSAGEKIKRLLPCYS